MEIPKPSIGAFAKLETRMALEPNLGNPNIPLGPENPILQNFLSHQMVQMTTKWGQNLIFAICRKSPGRVFFLFSFQTDFSAHTKGSILMCFKKKAQNMKITVSLNRVQL